MELTLGLLLGCNIALVCLTAINTKALIRPHFVPTATSVAVLMPARNEERGIEAATLSVLDSIGLENFTVIVCDDHSEDRTAEILGTIQDNRLQIVTPDQPTPKDWLGKPWACHILSENTTADILIFLDADVLLEPEAIASAIHVLETESLDFISPYPRQITVGLLGRLVQPLLQWSWLTLVPLAIAKRSPRSSLAVANGQFIACRRDAYLASGGHKAVASEVIEDVALLRAFLRAGLRGTVVDGTDLATCTMYRSNTELVNGYAKSLWNAFGGLGGSIIANFMLLALYVFPAFFIFSVHWKLALASLLTGALGRFFVARITKQHLFPDMFLHPFSISTFTFLNVISWYRHLRKLNTWKGRTLEVR